jgi:Mycothiol maleylpyruvate isomerase N-terminal domain
MEMEPKIAIALCGDAHRRLLATAIHVDDEIARRPSRLPGWTVGHVVTHLARNADGHVRRLEGALRGLRFPDTREGLSSETVRSKGEQGGARKNWSAILKSPRRTSSGCGRSRSKQAGRTPSYSPRISFQPPAARSGASARSKSTMSTVVWAMRWLTGRATSTDGIELRP